MTETTHTDTRHFGYGSAADEFEIPERWLRTHIKTLPHRKFGRYVRFSVADMLAISKRYAVNSEDETTTLPEPTSRTAMPDIRPSSRRRAANKEPAPARTGRAQNQQTPPRSVNSEKGH